MAPSLTMADPSPRRSGGADGGWFGSWSSDPPVFHLSADRPRGDIWHQVGNDRLTALAHADGDVVVYSSEAGLVRLTAASHTLPSWEWLGPDGRPIAAAGHPGARVQWHVGAASWHLAGDGWSLIREAWAPFGTDRMLRMDTALEVSDPALRGGTLVERWFLDPLPIVIGAPMSRFIPPPDEYELGTKLAWSAAFIGAQGSRIAVQSARSLLSRRLQLVERPESHPEPASVVLVLRHTPKWQRTGATSPMATVPGPVVVAALGDAARTVVRYDRVAATVELRTTLPSEQQCQASHGLALTGANGHRGRSGLKHPTTRAESVARWRGVWDLHHPVAEALARESQWHAGLLRSAQVAEPRFGTSYVAQGSAYGFLHGLQGGVRDYAMFLPPLCLIDPDGARSLLLTMLRMQHPDGSFAYAHTGAGHRTASVIHRAPTDLPIAVLWAATEYVWSTGDTAVLDVLIPWEPGARGARGPAATVGKRLVAAFEHLFSDVGVGAHGLIRVGSGDWNDPISSMAHSRRAFHHDGESVYNAAFAAYVLPRCADLLAERSPSVAAGMRDLARRQYEALQGSWTGRWFLRAHDGSGGDIGRDRLFLDANAWCLIAGVGTIDQRRRLIGEVRRRLIEPSPIGAVCLDAPIRVRGGILAPGWDTNGGVWAALNALLAWGLAHEDPDLAYTCLERQLFATHAKAYPGVWPGIWSGPDAFNAHYGRRPGGTYVQPATPTAEFPIMNANAHAGPLLALMKVLGLESGPDGLKVRRPGVLAGWRLSTTLGQWSG